MIGKTDSNEWQQGVIVELMILIQLVQVLRDKMFKMIKTTTAKQLVQEIF